VAVVTDDREQLCILTSSIIQKLVIKLLLEFSRHMGYIITFTVLYNPSANAWNKVDSTIYIIPFPCAHVSIFTIFLQFRVDGTNPDLDPRSCSAHQFISYYCI
jgi:hypothetical protein